MKDGKLRMRNTLMQFLRDDAGFVISSELVLILTIGVVGLIVGLNSLQNAITTELADLANAFGDLNQSYSYNGWMQLSGAGAGGSMLTLSYTKGSWFLDALDTGDEQPTIVDGNNIVVTPPMYEGGVN